MILGIKVGPQRQSLIDLEKTNAPFAEVWFDINRANEYTALFDELKRRRMQVGLHFWGVLENGISVSFGYPDRTILAGSERLVQKTIDIARKHSFQYVNIHPGCRAIVKIDLDRMDYPYVSKPIVLEKSQEIFLEEVAKIDRYAKNRNVILTVETVSRLLQKTDWYNPESRLKPFNIYQLPVASVQAAAHQGIAIANDFGHTASDPISADPMEIWKYLYDTTKSMFSATRLIHVGFLVPPFNGTDFHDTLENPVFETDQALPNKRQMIDLLRLFTNRDDVWILVEPDGRHAENYVIAHEILDQSIHGNSLKFQPL